MVLGTLKTFQFHSQANYPPFHECCESPSTHLHHPQQQFHATSQGTFGKSQVDPGIHWLWFHTFTSSLRHISCSWDKNVKWLPGIHVVFLENVSPIVSIQMKGGRPSQILEKSGRVALEILLLGQWKWSTRQLNVSEKIINIVVPWSSSTFWCPPLDFMM